MHGRGGFRLLVMCLSAAIPLYIMYIHCKEASMLTRIFKSGNSLALRRITSYPPKTLPPARRMASASLLSNVASTAPVRSDRSR